MDQGELQFDGAGTLAGDTGGAAHAVREAELRADVARMRLMIDWVLVMWTLTLAIDLVVRLGIDHASAVGVVTLRIAGTLMLLAVRSALRRPDMTHARLRRIRGLAFGGFAIAIGLQCAADRGIESPILLALIGVATVQATTAPMPLRAGAVRLAATALLGLGVALLGSSRVPVLADRLGEPAAQVTFAVETATILTSVMLLAMGGAAYWRLRRQVFASRLVGRYRLVERIGRGGMGEVWRARHPGLRRDVAIKILRSDRATAAQIARFEAEIAALSELSHPNTVRVYDSGVTDDGLCYYAMELLRGETLEARVRRAGPLDAETAASVMRQISRALVEAHERGIVHRDLTPRNVFLDASAGTELAKLIDFGIAARTTGAADGVVAGTPAFMAPEQARGEPASPAADLYAFGAVWFFALTGRLVAEASEPPSKYAAAIPPATDAIVARCLAADPRGRFPSARAIDAAIGGGAPVALAELPIPLDPLARLDGPTPSTATDDPDAHERRASYVRLTTILTWALVGWAAMGAIDVAISRTAGALGLPYFIAVRAGAAAVLLACVLGLRRGQPSARTVGAVRTAAFATLAIACALTAVGGPGLHSPTIGSMMFVLVAQGLASPDRVGVSLRRLGTTVAIFASTLLVGVAIRPPASVDLGMTFQYAFTVVAVTVLMSTAGKAHWNLRQQLFEQRVVGRYRLGRMLGAGGMGQVWSAEHPGLGREVAVKLLRPSDASAELVARFETEIHALTELAHPHTVRVYDCGTTDDGYLYYVMERLHGATLTHTVRADGVLDGRRAIRLARQIAGALGEAHAAGIVHRDLKPDNLFLTTVGDDREFVKVLDFGVAKRTFDHHLTRTGIAVGTPAFMAPEQALARPVDGRTDIYGLGAVMFFMLTGRPPFAAESNAILMLAHVHDESPRPSSLAIGIPHALDELVDRCLAKHPDDRPASMADLERELAAIERDYEELPVVTPPPALVAVASAEAPTLAARPAIVASPDDPPQT